jgi:hypothetical protein
MSDSTVGLRAACVSRLREQFFGVLLCIQRVLMSLL